MLTAPQISLSQIVVSHNEIVMFCRKALEGLGVSVGEMEDAAEAIGWLALHGIDAIVPFYQLLTERPQISSLQSIDAATFDGVGNSCLFIGPTPLDIGYAQAIAQQQTTLKIKQCRHPLFLLAYMIRCARRGVNLAARWYEPTLHLRTIVTIDAGASFPTISQYLADGEKEPLLIPSREVVDLTLSFAANSPLVAADLRAPRQQKELMETYSPAHFAAQRRHHIESGIWVDAATWAAVQEIGKLVLVEATEKSRQRGAGEAA